MHEFMTESAFRKAAEAGSIPPAASLRKSFASQVEKAGAARTLTFTISTSNVDRAGDTVSVAGWDLAAYKSNPVVLWSHDVRALPIGRATRVWPEGDKLKATAEFMPADLSRQADQVYRMLTGGWLSAVSVGFRPLKWKWAEDPTRKFGIDFERAELLEFSVVNVPANAFALIDPTIQPRKSDAALAKLELELETLR